MSKSATLLREQAALSIPLQLAVLCLDCDRVYASVSATCPTCASGQSLTIAKALDRDRRREQRPIARWFDRRGR